MTKSPAISILGIRVVAFLWGLQFSFLNPALALVLVSVFGASTTQVGGVLILYNSACMLTAWAIPRWADRHGSYVRPMICCAAMTVALALALCLASSLPLAIVGLVLLGAPAAVGSPLLFGYTRHSGAPTHELVRVRAMFSMAWVAGPPIASLLISLAGGRAVVVGIGAVGVANVFAISTLLRSGSPSPAPAPESSEPVTVSEHALVPTSTIALLVAVFAGLQAATATSLSIMTLFVTSDLHLSAIWGGVALSVAAGLEIPTLLLFGRKNRRRPDLQILSFACVVGIAYYVTMSVAPNGVIVVGAQILNATFFAVAAGVGITTFQSIIVGPGAAAGLLSNAQRLGGLLTGPLVALGSILPGRLRAVYVICAIVVVLAQGLLLLARRRLDVTSPGSPLGRPGRSPSVSSQNKCTRLDCR